MSNIEEHQNAYFSEATDQTMNYREILLKVIYHWPLFLMGVTTMLLLAMLYLRYVEPIYSISTTLLIKDEKSGNIPQGGDLLNELDLFGSSKVVDNEIEILKSKTIMRKVVERLSLSVNLSTEGAVKNSDLYTSGIANLSVSSLKSRWYGKTMILTFPSNDTYLIEERDMKVKIGGKLDQLQNNSLGVYSIRRGPHFQSNSVPRFIMKVEDPNVVADQILKQLTVVLTSKQSSVLNLTIQSPVPTKGQDILNTLVQVYNEEALIDKNKTTQSTIQFIDERLGLITGELTNVEKEVETFKSSRGLTDLSNDAELFLENVKMNDAKLNEINLQISVIKDIERYVSSNTAQEKLPSTLGINDPVLLGQITQLSDLQLQRDRLLATTTENNPMLIPLNKQIETTRAGIKTTISNIFKSLKISKLDLEKNDQQFQGSIKEVPNQERQLISIKRQQTIKESLYLYLLQKKEEAALSYASAVADSRIVDPAFFSESPVKPKKQLVYFTSFLIGLIIPAGLLYGRTILNNKVNSRAELSTLTSTPILGEILYSEDSEAIVVQASSRTAIAEQFRAIRTNMHFIRGRSKTGQGKVTLFTSGMSGEGKTFVATNLATALAIAGRKTVVMELDLRKPKVSKYLGLDNNIGISNFLIGDVDVKEVIGNSKQLIPNLTIIGSGPIPPNPSELLIQDDIENLIEYLKINYDEIIIDSPPIGLVTDAQILSRVADATIYLVRERMTFKEQAKSLDHLYRNKNFPNLSVILNGVRGGGSYGYGYGYYSDDTNTAAVTFKSRIKDITNRF